MSVYLEGSAVLLDSGSVATDAACCCGSGPCAGITHVNAAFTFSADDGTFFFSGSGSVSGSLNSSCNFSATVLVPVTVHNHVGADCTPDTHVACAVIITYLGGISWGLDTDVSMLDHSTVCDGGGWPPDSIVAALSTSFVGFSDFETLTPTTAIVMNATINVTLT